MGITITKYEQTNQQVDLATPIVAETGTTDGEWFWTAGYEATSYHVSGINGETARIYGANIAIQPIPSATHIQLGSDITADGIYTIVTPTVWQKIAITTGGAGTVSVYFMGVPKKNG